MTHVNFCPKGLVQLKHAGESERMARNHFKIKKTLTVIEFFSLMKLISHLVPLLLAPMQQVILNHIMATSLKLECHPLFEMKWMASMEMTTTRCKVLF